MQRASVASFAHPIILVYHTLFLKNPSGTFNWLAYAEPLHYLAWVTLAGFSIITPPVLYLVVRLV